MTERTAAPETQFGHLAMLEQGGYRLFHRSDNRLIPAIASISEHISEEKMKTVWTALGAEPSLHDVMVDPITTLLMRSDRIGPRDVYAAIEKVRPAWTTGGAGSPLADRPSKQSWEPDDDRHPLCRLSRICDGVLPVMGSAFALAALLILIPL